METIIVAVAVALVSYAVGYHRAETMQRHRGDSLRAILDARTADAIAAASDEDCQPAAPAVVYVKHVSGTDRTVG